MNFVDLVLSLTLATFANAYPNGAPDAACADLIPHHPAPVVQSVPPYDILAEPIIVNGNTVACEFLFDCAREI